MEKLKLSDFKFINAGPTTGKSTMAALLNAEKFSVLDPDLILFGWAMNDEQKLHLEVEAKKLGFPKPWHGPGILRETFNIAANVALAYANLVAVKFPDIRIITNLGLQSNGAKLRSLTVFRSAEEMHELAAQRAKEKGKSGESLPLSVCKSWEESWRKYNKNYSKAVLLERGQYLSDLFDLKVDELDVNKVDAINYGKFIEWLKLNQLDIYLPFKTR